MLGRPAESLNKQGRSSQVEPFAPHYQLIELTKLLAWTIGGHRSHHKSHHFRSVIGWLHSVLFRLAGRLVPIFRDLPSTARSRDSLLISRFSVRFRVGPLFPHARAIARALLPLSRHRSAT